jgi:hypothetical protein
MSFSPKTSREINIHRIKVMLKKVKKQEVTKQEVSADLNQRFRRLQQDDELTYDELYPKYIKLFKAI